jgi:hypothetical protein
MVVAHSPITAARFQHASPVLAGLIAAPDSPADLPACGLLGRPGRFGGVLTRARLGFHAGTCLTDPSGPWLASRESDLARRSYWGASCVLSSRVSISFGEGFLYGKGRKKAASQGSMREPNILALLDYDAVVVERAAA